MFAVIKNVCIFTLSINQKQNTMKNLNELCETFGNHYGYNFFLLQTDTTKESYIEMLIDNGFSPAEIHDKLNKQN